jgi:hypothetical protein
MIVNGQGIAQMIQIGHWYEEEAAIQEDWYAWHTGRAHAGVQEGSGR